jgi:hypothetical protein
MLLSLERVVDGSNATNLIIIITQEILVNGSISNPNFISIKLMSFGANGVNVFQGYHTLVLLSNSNPNFLHS